MSTNQDTLNNYPVLLSASLPDELKGTRAADDLYGLLVVLAGGILRRGGVFVFGGHPSVTPLVHRVATQMQVQPGQIRLYQLRRLAKLAPKEIGDRSVFGEVQWSGEAEGTLETLAIELESMRDRMVQEAAAAVFVGGRTQGFLGGKPGILDEFQRFRRLRPRGPAYILGALAGVSALLIRDRTEEMNSLTEVERQLLHETGDVDLAASLVLMDLERQANRPRSGVAHA